MKTRRLEDKLNLIMPAKRLQLLSAFFILAALVVFAVVSIVNPGDQFSNIFFWRPDDRADTFMDFYNSVYDTMYGPYEHDVIYPPLCCLIFKLIGSFLPQSTYVKEWVARGGFRIRSFQEIQFSLLMFFAIFIILFVGCMQKPLNKRGYFEKMFITLAMFLSTPVMFALERGNIIIYSFVFLLMYFICYDDNRPWLREVGYICLALSAAIKLYPAIFGLILIRDKRIKEAIRTVIYGIVFTVGPFVFFGGIKAIQQMLSAIGKFKATENYGISFSNGVSFVLFGSTGYHRVLSIGGMIVAACLIAAVFMVGKKPENRWKLAAALSLSMLGLVENCGKYMIAFMIIPWLYFFFTERRLKIIDYVYAILMTVMLAPFPAGIFNDVRVYYDRNTMIICWSAIIMSVLLLADVLTEFVRTHKKEVKQEVSAS